MHRLENDNVSNVLESASSEKMDDHLHAFPSSKIVGSGKSAEIIGRSVALLLSTSNFIPDEFPLKPSKSITAAFAQLSRSAVAATK